MENKPLTLAEPHVMIVAVALHVRLVVCCEKCGDFGNESLESH